MLDSIEYAKSFRNDFATDKCTIVVAQSLTNAPSGGRGIAVKLCTLQSISISLILIQELLDSFFDSGSP